MSEENTENTENTATVGTVEFPKIEEDVVTTTPGLIINALKCIDAAASRGTFQGGELSAVGSVRDELYALVADEVEAMAKKIEEEKASTKDNA